MSKLLRRLFWIALLGGAGYAVYTALQGRKAAETGEPPAWPPLDDRPAATPTEPAAATFAGGADPEPDADRQPEPAETGEAAEPPAGQRWVAPVDGACPDGYPIKGNADSGIYHVPGGRFYDRTIPERCYADEADAEADGYRRSKA